MPPRSTAPRLSARNRRFSLMFDARPDRLDFWDLAYQAPLRSLPDRYPADDIVYGRLPAFVKAGMVLDQKSQGACTGFGLAALVNYLLWNRELEAGSTRQAGRVSPYMLYTLARRYDEWEGEDYEGSSCRGALKGFHKHGVCQEALWPDARGGPRDDVEWEMDALKRPLGVYYRINRKSVVDMQSAIQDIGAIYVSARVHDGWDRLDTTGLPPRSHQSQQLPAIPSESSGSLLGGHAFALVGYNERGFIVQNSWGTGWGACGFAVMSYEDWVRHGTDAWAAALGVPQQRSHTPEAMDALRWPTRSGRSVSFSASGRLQPDNPADDPWPIDKPYLHKPYQPWSTAHAYEHTLVSGNNGHVVITDLAADADMPASGFVATHLERLRQRL
ncbi:MAG: C1 family peptidase [Burkholderiaceae bacterium]